MHITPHAAVHGPTCDCRIDSSFTPDATEAHAVRDAAAVWLSVYSLMQELTVSVPSAASRYTCQSVSGQAYLPYRPSHPEVHATHADDAVAPTVEYGVDDGHWVHTLPAAVLYVPGGHST